MNKLHGFILVLCLGLVGCDDHSSDSRPLAPDQDLTPDRFDAGNSTSEDAAMDDFDPGVAAYVELRLTPRKPLYSQSESPVVSGTVYDRFGNELPNFPLRFDTRPVESADVDEAGMVTFLREGAGAVRGCATPDLCGRASFFVDNAAPTLTITEPERGAYLTGERQIWVRGETEVDETVQVYVNDSPVTVDGEGRFETSLEARDGLNQIVVIADDGVRRPPTRSVREVVYAPSYLPRTLPRQSLTDVASIRVSQTALDAVDAVIADTPEQVVVSSASALLEQLIGRIDPMSLLDDPVLLDDELGRLTVVDMQLGVPELDALVLDEGLEIFFRLNGLTVSTEGQLSYEGETLNLNGAVSVQGAGFATLSVVSDGQGGFIIGLEDGGASIESLTATMEDETVQVLIEGIGNLLGNTLREVIGTYLDTLIASQIVPVVGVGFDSLLDPVETFTLEIEGDEILGGARVDLELTDASLVLASSDAIYFNLSAALIEPMGTDPAAHTLGIPNFEVSNEPDWPLQPQISVGLRLSAINMLLDSLWRQGLLNIDLSEQIPAVFMRLVSGVTLEGRLPPIVVPAPVGSPDDLIFQLGELMLTLESESRTEPDVFVASIRSGFFVDFASGGLKFGLTPDSTEIRFELVQAQDGVPILPPATIVQLIESEIWGQVEASLGEAFEFDLDTVTVDSESLNEYLPSLEALRLIPAFDLAVSTKSGWVIGGASTRIEIDFQTP